MIIQTSHNKRPNSTYLQGISAWVTGTPAGDLAVGDTVVWNGGGTTTVKRITRTTPAFLWIDFGDGYPPRQLRKDRIVAWPAAEMGLAPAPGDSVKLT